MDEDDLRARLTFLEEMFRALYRQGIVTDDMLTSVAERLSATATNHGPSEAGVLEHAALMASMLSIEARAKVTTASERRAEFQRAQMRERTAMLSDGGNQST